MSQINPYRSPKTDVDAEAVRSPRTSLIWTGMFAGVFVGATYGAAAGAIFGLIVGLLSLREFSEVDLVGLLVLLVVSGAIGGTIWAALLGAVLGAPLGWLAGRAETTVLRGLPAISGICVLVGSVSLTGLLVEATNYSNAELDVDLYQLIGLGLTAVVGGWAGVVLGRGLQRLRHDRSDSTR